MSSGGETRAARAARAARGVKHVKTHPAVQPKEKLPADNKNNVRRDHALVVQQKVAHEEEEVDTVDVDAAKVDKLVTAGDIRIVRTRGRVRVLRGMLGVRVQDAPEDDVDHDDGGEAQLVEHKGYAVQDRLRGLRREAEARKVGAGRLEDGALQGSSVKGEGEKRGRVRWRVHIFLMEGRERPGMRGNRIPAKSPDTRLQDPFLLPFFVFFLCAMMSPTAKLITTKSMLPVLVPVK